MKMTRLPLLLLLILPLSAHLAGQEAPERSAPPPAAPKITLESVQVDPATPGPDTLCRLTVTLRNSGEKTASAFAFRVTVDGNELPVYGNELFFRPVEPGKTAEVRLHNFWSSETGRPYPAAGRMKVEVSLMEGRWMDVATRDGAEIWTPAGEVEGLPSLKSVTLELPKTKPAPRG